MSRSVRLGLIVGLAILGSEASMVAMQQPVTGQVLPRADTNSAGRVLPAAGDPVAIYQLALKYDQGKQVPRDRARAEVLYRHAAEMGSADAMLRLGYLYENGSPTAHDYEQAASWYRQASHEGQNKAMFMLGVAYWSGRGVPQDYVEAYKWISLAETRSSGHDQDQAKTARIGISRMMSPAMIENARASAREWLSAFERRK